MIQRRSTDVPVADWAFHNTDASIATGEGFTANFVSFETTKLTLFIEWRCVASNMCDNKAHP